MYDGHRPYFILDRNVHRFDRNLSDVRWTTLEVRERVLCSCFVPWKAPGK